MSVCTGAHLQSEGTCERLSVCCVSSVMSWRRLSPSYSVQIGHHLSPSWNSLECLKKEMCLFNKEKQENNKSGLVIFSICLLYHLIEKQQTDGSYS